MLKKIISIILLCLIVMSLSINFAACQNLGRPYDPDDFIGMSLEQIVEAYGKYDHYHVAYGTFGGYRISEIGYVARESGPGFWDRIPAEYFLIHLDENGIAYKCTYETNCCPP